jgi:hypothetical protein
MILTPLGSILIRSKNDSCGVFALIAEDLIYLNRAGDESDASRESICN